MPKLQGTLPDGRSVEEQRQAALRASQQVREAKAAVCKAMRRGNMSLEEAMRHPCVWKMPILKLISQLPRVGPARATFICRCVHIEPSRAVGALNPRARAALVARHELLIDARKEKWNEYQRERRKAKAAA